MCGALFLCSFNLLAEEDHRMLLVGSTIFTDNYILIILIAYSHVLIVSIIISLIQSSK